MERPSFTQPTQHPTIPMVLSEPGVQPVIQVSFFVQLCMARSKCSVHFFQCFLFVLWLVSALTNNSYGLVEYKFISFG